MPKHCTVWWNSQAGSYYLFTWILFHPARSTCFHNHLADTKSMLAQKFIKSLWNLAVILLFSYGLPSPSTSQVQGYICFMLLLELSNASLLHSYLGTCLSYNPIYCFSAKDTYWSEDLDIGSHSNTGEIMISINERRCINQENLNMLIYTTSFH